MPIAKTLTFRENAVVKTGISFAGLAPMVVEGIFDIIRTINEQGVTVLRVEQNVRQALRMCDRAYVLENGHIVMEGTRSDLLENEQVKEAFLGV